MRATQVPAVRATRLRVLQPLQSSRVQPAEFSAQIAEDAAQQLAQQCQQQMQMLGAIVRHTNVEAAQAAAPLRVRLRLRSVSAFSPILPRKRLRSAGQSVVAPPLHDDDSAPPAAAEPAGRAEVVRCVRASGFARQDSRWWRHACALTTPPRRRLRSRPCVRMWCMRSRLGSPEKGRCTGYPSSMRSMRASLRPSSLRWRRCGLRWRHLC
jgi:hypothetical protein